MLSPCRAETGRMNLRFDADARQELAVLGSNRVEHLLRVVDEIHLVDDDDDLAHADQPQQVAVAPRLFLHAFGRVDEDERRIGARGAGHHVLDELLVAGRVDDDVFALRGAEPDLASVSIVMFWSRSACSASMRLANSNGTPRRWAIATSCSYLPSGSEPVS